MSLNFKNQKGISLVSLVVVVIMLLILSAMLIYNAQDTVYISGLTNLYTDIDLLREKVSEYYEEYGELPAEIEYTNTSDLNVVLTAEEQSSTFYVIDLESMQGITLNYGEDYDNIKANVANADTYTDVYIVNDQSHNVFYVKGVTVTTDDGTQTYYTDYLEPSTTTIDLRYIDGVLIPEGYYYIGKTEENGNEYMVISDVEGEEIDLSKTNQYIWVNQVSILESKPNSVILEENQNEEDFIVSVNFYKGYFKNIDGYVQYSEPKENLATKSISASDISSNPNKYYGKTVNYSANDITDWKIFYADSDNIFLITSDYLPIEKVPTLETGMTTTGTYQAYWDSVPTEQTVTSLNSSFMFTGFSDYSTNDNAKCVSTLLNTSNWSGFVNSTYADYCIGSPTLEMWVASWNNNYPSDLLYCNNPSSWGYYIGTSSSPTTYNISLNSYTGYSNTLYYPHTVGYNNCSGYWLASPSACRKGTIMSLHCEDKLTFYDYNETTISVRPLVRLQYGVNLTTENAGTCDFGLSQ